MSSEQKRKTDLQFHQASEDEVGRYLRSHPDFFERHPGLLAHLRLPHDPGDNTVSLIERQVAILREQNRKLDQKLRELVGVARANDVLSTKIHSLSMRLIGTTDLTQMLQTIEAVLHDQLGSDRSVLMLFGHKSGSDDLFEATFVRRLSLKTSGLEMFQTFLNTGRPRCGQIKGAKREFLFGSKGSDVESAALIPLGEKAATGILAIGSRDAARFHPGMSTDFLARLGELVDRGLASVS
ncbi:MAG: DUF484 family protein [Gammaproteobacteria bacterium]|nr:DUF484 family protein [Gammaproteobacteria bacterium]